MSPISGLTRLDQEWCVFPVFIGPVSAEYTRTWLATRPAIGRGKEWKPKNSRRKAVIHESNTVFCVCVLGIPNTPDKMKN